MVTKPMAITIPLFVTRGPSQARNFASAPSALICSRAGYRPPAQTRLLSPLLGSQQFRDHETLALR